MYKRLCSETVFGPGLSVTNRSTNSEAGVQEVTIWPQSEILSTFALGSVTFLQK